MGFTVQTGLLFSVVFGILLRLYGTLLFTRSHFNDINKQQWCLVYTAKCLSFQQ